jgi:hypothetical protein
LAHPSKEIGKFGARSLPLRLARLETEASETAVRRVREAAYPLIFKFGSEMARGKQRKIIWLGLVKTWLALKRRWDIDCDHRQASAGVLTGGGARRQKVDKR